MRLFLRHNKIYQTNMCVRVIVKHNQKCDARKCIRYSSHFVTHVIWSVLLLVKYRDQRYIPTSNASNTQIKDIYIYNTYIKYRDNICVINHQSQLTTFTSNQPTDALTLGVRYDCFCQFVLRTIEFELSGVIYMHFKSTMLVTMEMNGTLAGPSSHNIWCILYIRLGFMRRLL